MLWRVFQTEVKQLNTFNSLKDLKFFMHSWRQRDKNICNSDLTNILDQLKASYYLNTSYLNTKIFQDPSYADILISKI